METKLTVIVDNTPACGLRGEWGLSILVEYNGKCILADAGSSALFAENLGKLGFDASKIDYAVLSHAHFDHANGMPVFFSVNDHAKFYLRENAGEDCYKRILFFNKYIGLPRNVLSDFSGRIELVSGNFRLCEGAYLIPHSTAGLSEIGRRERMYRKEGRRFVPDDFSHEQSLVLDTDKGLVIINCCSHGGAVNIISEVRRAFPDRHVHGLIGGLHLYNKTDEEVRAAARAIRDTGIDLLCTGHCTGDRAYAILEEELGSRLSRLQVGLEMRF